MTLCWLVAYPLHNDINDLSISNAIWHTEWQPGFIEHRLDPKTINRTYDTTEASPTAPIITLVAVS